MKKFKKILYLLFLIILSPIFISCNNQNGNGNENNNQPPLPNIEESIQINKDEIIYISLDPSGQIMAMDASNHLNKTNFSYYEDYGSFNKKGHLNITSGRAKIIIDEDKALIPSLDNYENFFYLLSLDKDFYKDLLPFKINTRYKLNGYYVGYQSLVNANGLVELEIDITYNKNSPKYFSDNYAAQIQIPINLNNAEIISENGSMANIITGSSTTLAYMIMPKSETKLNIKLLVNNFKFEGIQATYQSFSIIDLASNYINIDGYDLNMLTDLDANLDLIISEFKNVERQINPLFEGIELMQNFIMEEELSQISQLIENLTSSNFKMGYRQPQRSIKLNIENRNELINKFTKKADELDNIINRLEIEYNTIIEEVRNLVPKIKKIENYPEEFKRFKDIVMNLEIIKNELNKLNQIGEFSFENILNNKELFSEVFSNIGSSSNNIENEFSNLILNIYSLPYNLEPLVKSSDSLEILIENLINFMESISILKMKLEDFVNEIKVGKSKNIFSQVLDPLNIIDRFVVGVEEGDATNPSLILALTLILEGFSEFELDNNIDMSQFEDLYKEDPKTSLRLIDELILGFITMNQALTLKQENQELSFYQGLELMNQLAKILIDLPTISNEEIVSFLSKKNLKPKSVQFIIKQQGF